MMDGSGYGVGMAGGLFIAMAVVLVLAISLTVAAWGVAGTARRRAPASPEASLSERYAAGVLTRQQYRDSLIDLLQEQYISGAIGIEEYEAVLDRLLHDHAELRPVDGRRAQTPA